MIKNLSDVVDGEHRVWRTRSGNFTEPHKMEDIGTIGNFIQKFMKEQFGEFLLSATESPYYKNWTYSNELVSTESKPGDDAELLGWLRNRGELVGWSAKYGSPFVEANYNPARPQDKKLLQRIYDHLLGLEDFRKRLKVVSQLTACCAHGGGKIMIQPWYHNPEVSSRIDFRWKRARTLIHEFLHAHAREPPGGQGRPQADSPRRLHRSAHRGGLHQAHRRSAEKPAGPPDHPR
nr:hypothetical protein GCM10020093_008040 [Planobispora longispora]